MGAYEAMQGRAWGRHDRLHGDEEFNEYSRAEESRIERETRRITDEKLTDARWWDERMEGVNALSAEVPSQLARMMGNLDRARKGQAIAIDAITTSLSLLRTQARRDVEAEARDEAERSFEAGHS